MQNSTTPNSRGQRGRVWLTAQFAAPDEVPGIRKVFSLQRMNPAVRNWNMPLLDASFRILVPLHQNRSRHVNCFQAHKA